jgi:hypothetical protein
MEFLDALQVLRNSLKTIIRDPLGIGSLLAFVIGGVGYVGLRDFERRARTAMLVLMCLGMMGIVSVDPNIPISTPSFRTADEPPLRDPPQTLALGSFGTSSPLPDRTPGGRPLPPTGGGSASSGIELSLPRPSGEVPSSSALPPGTAWVADGELSDEVWTDARGCLDAVTRSSCEAAYRLSLRAGRSQRLSSPLLRCVEGACAASRVSFTRVSDDQQIAESSFVVWGGPTRWRLIANVETLRTVR